MEEKKIKTAWKNEEPTLIVKSSSKFPFSGYNLKILSDERHVVLYEMNPVLNFVLILNAKNLEVFDQIVLPKEDKIISMKMNSNYLVAVVKTSVKQNQSLISFASLLIWNRSGRITECQGHELPWIGYHSLLDQYVFSSEDILKRVVKISGSKLNLEKWDLKKMTMIDSKSFHFEKDISLCPAIPLIDESDDLLIVYNYQSTTNQTFCRYSKSGECLWEIKENSYWKPDLPLKYFNSEFLLFGRRVLPKVKLVFANLSDGKVHKIWAMPEIIGYICFVELCGSQIAIQVMCDDKSADVFIYDWRSGVLLTKLSQIFGIPLNKKGLNCFNDLSIALHYSFQPKKVYLFTAGYLYSASFEPDLRKTWKNQTSSSKIRMKLVPQAILPQQPNDPNGLNRSTNENLSVGRIQSGNENDLDGQVSVNLHQSRLLSRDLHQDRLEESSSSGNLPFGRTEMLESENPDDANDQNSLLNGQLNGPERRRFESETEPENTP
jgi:hypothetical protein